METRVILAPLLALLVASSLLVGAVVPRASAGSQTEECSQSVEHDVFRTASAIDAVNQSGEATSTVSNTEVRVEDVTGFIRLHAQNPNGYCVSYTVEISPEIVSAADLGEVDSLDDGRTASWRAEQNLTSGDVYTRVEFTLGPGANATWSPSSVRVQSLSWTGTAKNKSQGLISSLSSLLGESKLEQQQYTISPSGNASRVTVPLEHDGEEIDEWQATYSLEGAKRPVDQDASQPVYYTESSSSVTFHFSDTAVEENTSVAFTAEPGWLDKTRYSAESYWSGFELGRDLLPFVAMPTEGIGA